MFNSNDKTIRIKERYKFESQWNSYHIYDKLVICRKNILDGIQNYEVNQDITITNLLFIYFQ